MAELARDLGIDRLITVGAPAYGGEDVAEPAEAARRVGLVRRGDAVLVKGSRAAGLERLAAELLAGPGAEAGAPPPREAAAW
jgi:UDP-N-acetylmuramoyl-tripeptide--D-alanyl-D-alanine ligase